MDKKLMKYIPKRKQVAVKDVYHDSDGYWVKLHDGWQDGLNSPATVMRFDTLEEMRTETKYIERV